MPLEKDFQSKLIRELKTMFEGCMVLKRGACGPAVAARGRTRCGADVDSVHLGVLVRSWQSRWPELYQILPEQRRRARSRARAERFPDLHAIC